MQKSRRYIEERFHGGNQNVSTPAAQPRDRARPCSAVRWWTASGGARTFSPVARLFRRFLSAGLIASLIFACADAAEKKDTRPVLDPPPPAIPQQITILRGGRIDIPLRIYGVQNEPLRYLIKSAPAHGKLSEPRVTTREVSTVTYEPPADLAITADRFTYSVQSHAGVSAPVEVSISITDAPARLTVANTVEFGELLAGDRAVREIEVANRGGGVIEGTVEVDPPFAIEGRRTYRLEAGDYTYFKVVFAPGEGGVFHREIRYSSDREFVTSLVGSAQTPIAAEPERLEIRNGEDSTVRTGAFEIVNRTGEERTFSLQGGPRLQLAPNVTVAAHARTAIAVSTRPEDVAELTGAEVSVEAAGFALRVPVHGDRVGPILRVPQHNVALGRVDAARGAQAAVEIENVGGTVAHVAAAISAPFSLGQDTFDLLPGERKQLLLSVEPGAAQLYRTWAKFSAGPSTAELEIDAELVNNLAASRGSSVRPDSSSRSDTATATDEIPPWMPDLNLAKSIRVTSITSTAARVEWPVELQDAPAFRVERLMLTRDSSQELRNAWVEIPHTSFTREGPIWVANLKGLEPLQSQTIRVVPLLGEGRIGGPLFQLDFNTRPAHALLPRPQLVPSLFLILLAIGGVLVWRRMRRQFTEPISGF